MLRHAREGPIRCRTREAASIFRSGLKSRRTTSAATRSASAPSSDGRSLSELHETAKARHGGPSALLVQVNRDVRGCAFLLHDHVILRLVDD